MYEAANVIPIGTARELILGIKPFLKSYIDAEWYLFWNERVFDIDETDD